MSVTQLLVDGARAGTAAEVVASLPMSYGFTDGAAQVAVVDGSAGWPARARAAIKKQVRGVIVTDPTAVGVVDIRQLSTEAADAGVTVMLSEPWAGNPTVLGVAAEWRAAIGSARTIEISVIEAAHGDTNSALTLRQLRLLRRLGAIGAVLEHASDTNNACSRLGSTKDGAQVTLFAVRSSGSTESVDIVATTPTQTVSIRMKSPRTARPACAVRLTPTGGETFPTIYETAHRATFVLMHELLMSGSSVDELTGFADDVTLAMSSSVT